MIETMFGTLFTMLTSPQVNDKGKEIVFNSHDGKKMTSRPGGSRTQIAIAGKEAKRDELKAGMTCEINYKSGAEEPASIDCK